MIKHVAFTGSRSGMTPEQRGGLLVVLRELRAYGANVFRHGCCIGSDRQAHDVAKMLNYEIHGYPGDPGQFRWAQQHQEEFELINEPMYYLDRNRQMVNESDVLVATPESHEVIRSGTWATIRYARKDKKKRLIIVDRAGNYGEPWWCV